MTVEDDHYGSGVSSAPIEDQPGTDETAEQAVERLTQALQASAEEVERHRDQYLRERAELENFKRRMQREKGEALRYATEALVRDLLPVIDNLERAIDHAPASSDGKSLAEGVRLVLKSALDVLERHGVKRIEASGPFDPSRHEAVAQMPNATLPANQVVQQFEPGYELNGRLIRAAKVSVSTKPPVETP
ncbi:MAG: nucleotide exchange factor GrpE [Candidatus Binatia bacterium]